jgi:hypothetical protein
MYYINNEKKNEAKKKITKQDHHYCVLEKNKRKITDALPYLSKEEAETASVASIIVLFVLSYE